MKKTILSILLSCSFAAFASDFANEQAPLNRSQLACQEIQAQIAKLQNSPLKILTVGDLRAEYLERAAINLPEISFKTLRNFAKSSEDIFQVEGKNQEVFTLSADKSTLYNQLPSALRQTPTTPVFVSLNDTGESVNLTYNYTINLSVISRGSHPINLILHTPEELFNQQVKESLMDSIHFLFKVAKKTIIANNSTAKDDFERRQGLLAEVKAIKAQLLENCNHNKFETTTKEIQGANDFLLTRLPAVLKELEESQKQVASVIEPTVEVKPQAEIPAAPPLPQGMKVPAIPAAPVSSQASAISPAADLLESIRQGKSLRSAKTQTKEEKVQADPNSLINLLSSVLDNRRANLNEEETPEDNEWSDEE